MSRFLKISAALVGSFIVSTTAFAQSTIEELSVDESLLKAISIARSNFGVADNESYVDHMNKVMSRLFGEDIKYED